MNKEEQDKTKIEITQRFIDALDFLIDTGRLKNVVQFEEKTGLRSQRITAMRKFLNDNNSKAYYANTDYLVTMNRDYGVSLEYLINGIKPILLEQAKKETPVDSSEFVSKKEYNILKEDMRLLKERVNLVNEKLEVYKKN